jgi:lysophospholipase L1-like esterase
MTQHSVASRTPRRGVLTLIVVVLVAGSLSAGTASAQAAPGQPPASTSQAPATAQSQVAAQAQAIQPVNPSCPEMAQALTALMRNDARLRDWAALARYRQANASLAKPSASEARVVFMGDSITDAWPQPRFGRFFEGRPYVGRGISGQTTPQMLVRFRPDVIALAPKVVVILAGTNDIAGNTGPMTDEDVQGNLASMSELAKANGIKVVLSSILPTSAYHAAPGAAPQTTLRPMARIKALNAWMERYARENGHVYLDYFSAMVDGSGVLRAELSEDDLHPNAKGYAIMAPLAEAAIARAVANRQ